MGTKKEIYKKDQEAIVNKLIRILNLEAKQVYTLYELDRNPELQQQILNLIPEIRKYYSFNGMKAVGAPEKIKRPWLSIIKYLVVSKYTIITNEVRIKHENREIRTMEYNFNLII